MEGPKHDEIRRNNRSEIKREEHEEELYAKLQEDGISCDDCGERFFADQLHPKRDEDDKTILVCFNCL